MITNIYIKLLAINALTLSSVNAIEDDSVSKITGGTDALPGEFPYMAHVIIPSVEEGLECGGVIISDTRVLTSCHCLAQPRETNDDGCVTLHDPKGSYVTAGSVNRNESVSIQKVISVTFQVHQKCKANELDIIVNDLGIIIVAEKFHFNNKVGPAMVYTNNKMEYIAQIDELVARGISCQLPGWGYQVNNSKAIKPAKLKKRTTYLLSTEDCKTQACNLFSSKLNNSQLSCPYRTFSSDTLFCGKFQNDACFGDAGGPVICGGHLVALVSDAGLCNADQPTFFISLDDVLDMIPEDFAHQRLRIASSLGTPPVTVVVVDPKQASGTTLAQRNQNGHWEKIIFVLLIGLLF